MKRLIAAQTCDAEVSDKPMTNADRIRQMTDEELADVMQGQCACCEYQLTGCTEKECKEGAYKWLKQEVLKNEHTIGHCTDQPRA